jgi:hypothetical protein
MSPSLKKRLHLIIFFDLLTGTQSGKFGTRIGKLLGPESFLSLKNELIASFLKDFEDTGPVRNIFNSLKEESSILFYKNFRFCILEKENSILFLRIFSFLAEKNNSILNNLKSQNGNHKVPLR